MTMDLYNHLQLASFLVDILYDRIGFGKYRFGLYSFLAIVPGIGDIISLLLAVYIFWIAAQLTMPVKARIQMFWNLLIDMSFGAVPVAGDIADTLFKAHVRNIAIMKKYAPERIIEGTYTSHSASVSA